MLIKTFQLQIEKIKSNKTTFFLLLILSAVIIWFGNKHDAGHGHSNVIQAIGYLFAMWLCAYCIDLYAVMRPLKRDFVVRRPLLESVIAFISPVLGGVCILMRFSGQIPWEQRPGIAKLPIFLGLILFLYPIALAIIMLLLKYKLKDLGFRVQGFIPGIVVLIITALTAYIVAPGRFTIHEVLQEGGGIIGALVMGFIYAALPEEFLRLILQTRFGALLRNTGAGWLIASLIWGLLHGPKWYGETKDFIETILSCLRIVPLGLMWGYLTHRTKSILPSILAHGMNVWGLQSF
ncbi:MAG TPA: CPBP family intramembrane glutamic endopeptidase [Flavipsychrobacter sp.]|nr:CPBP family intramembrane glutamic endopeptidase [Flavipsychrobacter sp.]